MGNILALRSIRPQHRRSVGGKGFVLSILAREGFAVPETLCVTTEGYNAFLDLTGLRERIMLELYRKDLGDMRWEEIWDASTRIRSLFVNTPMPESLRAEWAPRVEACFKDKPVAVRSSAIEEDSAQASFAGLHTSIVNVAGERAVLDAIRQVWASLWSDAAILYRNEIGLDTEKSAMAVVVQEMICSESAGVAFSRDPNDESRSVVEAVYGLNQGLVDGQVEPDRWIVDRKSLKIIAYTPARREKHVVPSKGGVAIEPLPATSRERAPLRDANVLTIIKTADTLERLFKRPQDIEWAFKNKKLYLLQARPITTTYAENPQDKRNWYLSLHRSFENLQALRKKIEKTLIPEMIRTASQMRTTDLASLSDQELAAEIERRQAINTKWANIYWADFIPFAHGIRLFGQVYNDVVRPDNPYEFTDLLGQTQMESLARNRMLEALADRVRNDPPLRKKLENKDYLLSGDDFTRKVNHFIEHYGDLSCPVTGATQCGQGPDALIKIVLEMAAHPPMRTTDISSKKIKALREKFLGRFENGERAWAEELLDLARASYRLRDDDNIHLGRIEAQALAAVQEGQRRLHAGTPSAGDPAGDKMLREALATAPSKETPSKKTLKPRLTEFTLKARQLTGQPAGPGVSKGRARVIANDADLTEFKHGEILVCDAVDPNMTFVVPLAAGIVERRGGMLIHGAIIAREYGLPCVTGVTEATRLIKTGDAMTVDGYLGIVTIGG